MDTIYVGLAIEKIQKQADGSVLVWGPCTTDDVDSDRQIIDPEFAAKGLSAWLETGGNVREMHQPKAVGKGVEIVREGTAHWLKSRVVADETVKLVENKVLTAYSVGISNARIIKDIAAPGGRIVGGTFVEVSLVDRPANGACKIDLVDKAAFGTVIDLVTKSDTGEAFFTQSITHKDGMPEGNVKCPTCKGDGKIMEGNRKCPDCTGDGSMSSDKADAMTKAAARYFPTHEEWVAKRTMDPNVGGGVDRDKIPADQFAGKNRSYPITTPGDVEDAASSIGRAGSDNFSTDELKANIIRIAKKLGPDFEAKLPDSWKKAAKAKGKVPPDDKDVTNALDEADDDLDDAKDAQAKDNAAHLAGDDDTDDDATKAAAPYVVKRLHDVTCPCYSTPVVLEGHPALKALGEAVDPEYWKKATEAAFAAGPDSAAPMLAVYSAVDRLSKMSEDDLTAARDHMHKAFANTYPNVKLTPGAVAPGQFKRPFISGGRASMKPGGKPKMPAGATSVSPSDFDRTYISSGHASNSPSAGPAHTSTKTDAIKDAGADAFKVTHIETGVAYIAPTEKDAYKAVRAHLAEHGGIQIDSWKQRMFYTNNAKDQGTQVMQAVHDYITMAHPDVCSMKAPSDDMPDDNDDDPEDMPNNSAAKPKPVAGAASVGKADKDIAKKLAKMQRKIDAQEAEIQKLKKEPDPEDAGYRGTRVLPSLVKNTAATTEEPEDRAKVEKAEELAWLAKGIAVGDPETKRNCLEKLQRDYPEEVAEILVNA